MPRSPGVVTELNPYTSWNDIASILLVRHAGVIQAVCIIEFKSSMTNDAFGKHSLYLKWLHSNKYITVKYAKFASEYRVSQVVISAIRPLTMTH